MKKILYGSLAMALAATAASEAAVVGQHQRSQDRQRQMKKESGDTPGSPDRSSEVHSTGRTAPENQQDYTITYQIPESHGHSTGRNAPPKNDGESKGHSAGRHAPPEDDGESKGHSTGRHAPPEDDGESKRQSGGRHAPPEDDGESQGHSSSRHAPPKDEGVSKGHSAGRNTPPEATDVESSLPETEYTIAYNVQDSLDSSAGRTAHKKTSKRESHKAKDTMHEDDFDTQVIGEVAGGNDVDGLYPTGFLDGDDTLVDGDDPVYDDYYLAYDYGQGGSGGGKTSTKKVAKNSKKGQGGPGYDYGQV